MLGAYFGSTKITQGAGGLGQDGELASYADGVFARGDRGDAETPGDLFSFHDGSLGMAPLQSYADGSVGGGHGDQPGTLSSYEDGIFASGPTVDYETSGGNGGGQGPTMPGGGGDSGGGSDTADHPAPIQAYADGVFGGRGVCGLGDDADGPTPVDAFDDGVLGRPGDRMYGGLQAFHDGSLGADTPTSAVGGVTLDLGDATTLAEVKSLIGMAGGAGSVDGQKIYTPDFYTSGIWEPLASQLWQYVVSTIPSMKGQSVSGSAGDQTYPNALGLGILVGMAAAPTAGGGGPGFVKNSFPTLYAWFAAGGGPVLPPYLSIADKTKGQRGGVSASSMSNMAMWGLGAAALLGLALVLTRKK